MTSRYMYFFPSDHEATTAHLTPSEYTAYCRIMFRMWDTDDGTLPNDEGLLKRIARLPRQWKTAWKTIGPMFKVEGDRITHERLRKHHSEVAAKREQAREAGRRGGITTQQRHYSAY